MLYYKYKLVRFTGVPLNKFGGVWRLYKNKNSGLKQTNVPRGGRVTAERAVAQAAAFSFDHKKTANYHSRRPP